MSRTEHITVSRPRTAAPVHKRRPGGRSRRRPETARRILEAAEQAFADQGLAGARTDKIARAAGVNKALLYYYFHSKDELYGAVLDSLFARQRGRIDAARGAAPLPRPVSTHRQELIAFVNGYFDFVIEHPNFPRLVQREVMSHGKHFQRIMRRYWMTAHRQLVRAIESGIAEGEFRPVDPAQTVLSMIAMTVFYFASAPVLRVVWGREPLHPRAIAARRQAVLDFLEHGLFQPSKRKQ